MKILFLSLGGTYPFRIGGPSIVAYNLVREFDKKGIEVHFVFGISRNQLNRIYNVSNPLGFTENVKLIPIVKNERSPDSYKTSVDSKFLGDIHRLSKNLNQDFDLIHFHWIPNTRDIFVPLLSSLKNIPTIYYEAGWINYETFAEKKAGSSLLIYYNYFTFMLLRHLYKKVVCNSNYLKNRLVSDRIFEEEKIDVIPNGIDNERFRKAPKMEISGDPVLLFVGRFEHVKGVDILVQSMKTIAKELPRSVLHMVGDGSMLDQLRSYVRSNGLEQRVVFHGRVLEKMPSFYKSADICIVPSRFETFGLVILEAMSAGKPIVASRRGGIPELIENSKNGILVEPDANQFSKSIVSLWNNKGLLNEMHTENLRKVKNYEWSEIAEQYIDTYRNALKLI